MYLNTAVISLLFAAIMQCLLTSGFLIIATTSNCPSFNKRKQALLDDGLLAVLGRAFNLLHGIKCGHYHKRNCRKEALFPNVYALTTSVKRINSRHN
jgi:hypothetical protein